MDFKEFTLFCEHAWDKKHGFVVINIWDDAYWMRIAGDIGLITTKYIFQKYSEKNSSHL